MAEFVCVQILESVKGHFGLPAIVTRSANSDSVVAELPFRDWHDAKLRGSVGMISVMPYSLPFMHVHVHSTSNIRDLKGSMHVQLRTVLSGKACIIVSSIEFQSYE